MTFIFLVPSVFLHILRVPLSTSSVPHWSLWYPFIMHFSTLAVLTTSFATAVFSRLILLSLSLSVLRIVGLWRLWAPVMLSSGTLLAIVRLHSLCEAVFMPRVHPSTCSLWVPLSSAACLACFLLVVLRRSSILVAILSYLVLPSWLLSLIDFLFFDWTLSLPRPLIPLLLSLLWLAVLLLWNLRFPLFLVSDRILHSGIDTLAT